MSWMKSWPEICWKKRPDSFLSMFQGGAVRNPANNLRYTRGIAVNLKEVVSSEYWGDYTVHEKYGKRGWQFVTCKGKMFRYFGFYAVGKKWYIRLGHKIQPNHFVDGYVDSQPPRKLWKGMTFRVRPVSFKG